MVKKRWLPAAIAIANILFFLGCMTLLTWEESPDYGVKQRAVAQALQAQAIIGPRLIGEEYTPITTTLGSHDAKGMAMHPDFAAVAVHLLKEAGVNTGDKVAINVSGSFPALTVAVLAAVDAMGAEPLMISSAGASTWGANRPEYTWLDMEQSLVKAGIWQWRSLAVSRGGGSDQGQGLLPEGVEMLDAAIERSGLPLVSGKNSGLEEAIRGRVQLYEERNNGSLPKVLINVGGNHAIFGARGHGTPVHQGLTQGYHPYLAESAGLAAEFTNKNRSVIHFININRLAVQYDIRTGEQGTGKVFRKLVVPKQARLLIVGWVAAMLGILLYGKKKAWWRVG